MKTLQVNTGRPYKIHISRGILNSCGEYINEISGAKRAMIISDSNVFPIYGKAVTDSLEKNGFSVFSFVFKAGEEQKNLSTTGQMYNALITNEFTRKDIIIALGGGVTGDMAGFAAATYLRGIDFVQLPTSLLAQVDSSVGGKTGIDLPFGKNLVGAFWQPCLVLIDPATLSTLPGHFFTDGMGEVIKYGCIESAGLFEQLEKADAEKNIEDIIFRCVSIKRDIVQQDEQESGKRMLLNFGHTFGHALERAHNFSGLSHGSAVAIGMVMMTKCSEKSGLTELGTAGRIEMLCKKYKLPITDNTKNRTIALYCGADKKSIGTAVNLVVLSKIGSSKIFTIEKECLEQFISQKDS